MEYDAGVVVGRMQRECDGKSGMHADAGDGDLIAQRGLLSALHSTRSAGSHRKPRGPIPGPGRSHIFSLQLSDYPQDLEGNPLGPKSPFHR